MAQALTPDDLVSFKELLIAHSIQVDTLAQLPDPGAGPRQVIDIV